MDAYNTELRDDEGFLGDRASRRAFVHLIDAWRERLRAVDDDPLGETPTAGPKLDQALVGGDLQASGLILSAIEEFAQELAGVIRRFLVLPEWQGTQAIVVGGGLRASRVGALAIGRAAVLLKGDGRTVDLTPIHHHPEQAGLIGAVHLAPAATFAGRDAILAVDIGGTNIRAGLVALNRPRAPACIIDSAVWRYSEDEPSRDDAIARLAEMLRGYVQRAEQDGIRLAPFIGIGCPGVIRADGTIARGGQNLPGNWEGAGFNLPRQLGGLMPRIGAAETIIMMHNDAVVQGLSEVPRMRAVEKWGVLTIGTGLGNARFSRRDC